MRAYFVSGSAAFTNGIRRLLGRRLEGLVRFTDYFWNVAANSVDVLMVDEAHRIRDRSQPRVPQALRPQISQLEELIRVARVVVFLAAEHQIISPSEVGEPDAIRRVAHSLDADFEEYALVSQFRCSGSSVYLDWLSDVLGLNPDDEGLQLVVSTGFDFRLVLTPHALLTEIQQLNRQMPNSARLVAGWCWPWSDPKPDGSLVEDIVIGDFRFPWEAKNESRPLPGIPQAKWWAVDPGGINQAGTVYSVQGLEASHIGVIMGPDLVRRSGEWVAKPHLNYSNSLRQQPPDKVLPYLQRIYRTLLSRPMQSCRVDCLDEETREYFESRIQYAATLSRGGAVL